MVDDGGRGECPKINTCTERIQDDKHHQHDEDTFKKSYKTRKSLSSGFLVIMKLKNGMSKNNIPNPNKISITIVISKEVCVDKAKDFSLVVSIIINLFLMPVKTLTKNDCRGLSC